MTSRTRYVRRLLEYSEQHGYGLWEATGQRFLRDWYSEIGVDEMAMTVRQLDTATCSGAGTEHPHTDECNILYMHARCHPSAGTRVHYDKRTRQLHIECRQCSKPVIAVEVAP